MNDAVRELLSEIPQDKAVNAVSAILFAEDAVSLKAELSKLELLLTVDQCQMILDAMENEDED